jgi:hypothetical protein
MLLHILFHFHFLYSDRHHQYDEGISLWVPFQNAAGSVTHLYRGKLCGIAGVMQAYSSCAILFSSLSCHYILFKVLRVFPCEGIFWGQQDPFDLRAPQSVSGQPWACQALQMAGLK